MSENWRPVHGYDGHYEVSDHGRVRSLKSGGARLMKQSPSDDGHLQVGLSLDGRRRTVRVHRIVLEAFVGLCPDGMEGLHWDDDPTNNALANLRWGTRSDNLHDRVRNGRHPLAGRETCPRHHILAEPNLVKAVAARGHRACLACDRERASSRSQDRRFDSARADRRFAEILNGKAS